MNDRTILRIMCREARLTISPVVTTDEGEYKCEITFLGITHRSYCRILK